MSVAENKYTTKPRSSSSVTRATLGLVTWFDPVSEPLRAGVVAVAREQSVNVITFLPGFITLDGWHDDPSNVLYDLISPERIDALVMWTGALMVHITSEQMLAFLEQYRPLPIVGLTTRLPGVPSVLPDDYGGVRAAIQHLIDVHHYRHIAYIRGPEGHFEADIRHQAYVDALRENGLPIDSDLIVNINDWWKGKEAIGELLDARGLQIGRDIEAIVGACDVLTVDAWTELHRRGLQVPRDVALVGFDDDRRAEYRVFSLTTVHRPMYQLGRRAAEMALALLAGETVPENVVVPSPLVVRHSCGCVESSVSVEARSGGGSRQEQRAARIAVVQKAGQTWEPLLGNTWAAKLWDACQADIQRLCDLEAEPSKFSSADDIGEKGDTAARLLSTLSGALHRVVSAGGDVAQGQVILSMLREQMLSLLLDPHQCAQAENLWHQARVLIGDAMAQMAAYHEAQREALGEKLDRITQGLAATYEIEAQLAVLAQELPHLGMPKGYVTLYDDPAAPNGWGILVLDYQEGFQCELEASERRFLVPRLVPGDMLHETAPFNMVVWPLYFQQMQLGFALLACDETCQLEVCYERLRAQISSALRGALLFQAHKRAKSERERLLQEQAALQQEVIDAQREALKELSTPVIPVMDRVLVMPLVGNIDSMRAKEIMRTLLQGISVHRAKYVILDVTGVPVMDTGIVNHLNKTIQAARLKGARVIVTGISDVVAESIVDLGIDWGDVETLRDLQTGLRFALDRMGIL